MKSPNPAGGKLLEVQDVRRQFNVGGDLFRAGRPLHALRGVSLTLDKGQTLAIVGESGCGKSTLAKIILGLDSPTSGTVKIAGEQLGSMDRLARTRLVQPVFQDPYGSLNPRKRIADIVALPLDAHRIGDRKDRLERAREVLDLCGLPARTSAAFPHELSGGQRQRVSIARALSINPSLLICDEPTSALDVSIQSQILNLLRDLQTRLGLSMIFITHNLSIVRFVASQIAVMYQGEVMEAGPVSEIYARPKHPYSRLLLASALPPVPGRELPPASEGVAMPDPTSIGKGCSFAPRCNVSEAICSTSPAPKVDQGGVSVRCHAYA